jgi:protein ImuB
VRSAQAALLDVARSFSPRVALEPAGEVCLDLGGLSRLHPSEEKLLGALLIRAGEADLPAQAGLASTRFCARMAAMTAGDGGLRVLAPGQEPAFLAGLPVSLLTAASDLHAALNRFGIETLGQLAALPPRGLGRRLGPAGLALWRQARGEEERPLVAEKARERFIEETDAAYPIGQVEPLLFVLRGVFERLSDRLRFRGLVARRLMLSLSLDPVGCDERFCDLASGTAEVRTWLPVVKLSLEENPPREPVCAIRAEVQVAPARTAQLDLFGAKGPSPEKLDDVLARLVALSGEERVGSPRPVDSHRPGEYVLVPFGEPGKPRTKDAPVPRSGGPPVRAIRPPEAVRVRTAGSRLIRLEGEVVRGGVRQYAGPWRLACGWWEAEALGRDYYEVELSGGGIYRVYRDHGTGEWFIDGVCG